ncbi:DUF1801 domain-containing protein [Actinoplanes sp. NPDC051513]|uniref:DUF1801 domain-containing protein n=1 Tax=Actinoplanes sp. NPDC051513 TaxID=3363908 RepID=UPI0037BAC639
MDAFLETIPDERRRAEARLLIDLMTEVTGQAPELWPANIVGFGKYHYKYDSGREGDTIAVGFAPRKAQTVVYVTGYLDNYADLLERLGPHTHGKGCLYLKRVADIDTGVLREIVARSYRNAAPA